MYSTTQKNYILILISYFITKSKCKANNDKII